MASRAIDPAVDRVQVETDELDDLFIPIEEGRRMFDEAARRIAGMSGAEFIRRFDAGDYAEIADDAAHRDIIELALFVDSGR